MKAPARLPGWLPIAAVALVLIAILTFLYARSREHDASRYFEDVALLRQLKQLDSRWELDVMKSRMGISTNYDSLVDPLSDLTQLREKLHLVVAAHQHPAGSLSASEDAFKLAVQAKTSMIEHFKSQNSVLRNSLVFLPTAAGDLLQAVAGGGDPAGRREVAALVSKVLLDSMVYSHSPADDKAAEVLAGLAALQARRQQLSSTADESLEIYAAHVRTLLREQPVVDGLLSSIAAVPVAARIDAIDSLLSDEQRANGIEAVRYQRFLLVFATALAALLLYAAASLIRSHAVINRVNRELQGANSTLERRVLERTGQLRDAQNELVTTARRAGMAEIANNVLHNVGNVLNSVNISAGLVAGMVRNSKVQWVGKSIQLLNENAADLGTFLMHDEKGRALPGYLNKLSIALVAEQEGMSRELASLTRSVDHIKEIVSTQQTYAGASSVVDAVEVVELLDDALRINATDLYRLQITIEKQYSHLPKLLLDKHLVLQILVNLVRNASQAMGVVPDQPHQLTLRAEVLELAAGRRLRISVEDNGEGIDPRNMAQLFMHGFTTRKNGHGFGLHSCAVAAQEMGGALTARSEGPGRGAVFTLELPARLVETPQ